MRDWQQETRNYIKSGQTYSMSTNSGEIKCVATGDVEQFGGQNSGGAIWAKVRITESDNERYPEGSYQNLNAEFLRKS